MNNTTLQKATDINKLNKQILTDFMSQNGIDRIILNFDGSGDSGQIDECRCYPELKDKYRIKSKFQFLKQRRILLIPHFKINMVDGKSMTAVMELLSSMQMAQAQSNTMSVS
jgi:hypothetical protein